MKKLLLSIFVISCLMLCGCGGGSDSVSNGLTPEQQEYFDVFMTFVGKVNEKSTSGAMSVVLSELVYNKDNNGHESFRVRLENYLSNIDEPCMTVGEHGVEIIDSENKLANVRAVVTYKGFNSSESVSETLQVQVDCSTSSHGIKRFHAINDGIAQFPPVLE